MSIQIQQRQWIEIYNSITLFWFLVDSSQNYSVEIYKINEKYSEFCNTKGIPGHGFNIIAPENLIPFGYSIIVRIKEITEPAIKGKNVNGKTAREFLYDSIFNAALSYNIDWFSSYDNLVTSKNIDIRICTYNHEPEYEKLYQFISHLRHSIAHSTYEMRDGGNEVYFISKYNGTINFEALMSIQTYIDLVLYFGIFLNRVLHQENLLN